MNEELKTEMEKLAAHMKIFHAVTKKLNMEMATSRVRLGRERKDVRSDFAVLANGAVQK